MNGNHLVNIFEVAIIIIMLLGWTTMLAKSYISEYYELPSYNPLKHGFIIFLLATSVFIIISNKNRFSEWLCIGMIAFGMFSLCQPFAMTLYRCGFQTILVGTVGFIIVSHKKPIKAKPLPKA